MNAAATARSCIHLVSSYYLKSISAFVTSFDNLFLFEHL